MLRIVTCQKLLAGLKRYVPLRDRTGASCRSLALQHCADYSSKSIFVGSCNLEKITSHHVYGHNAILMNRHECNQPGNLDVHKLCILRAELQSENTETLDSSKFPLLWLKELQREMWRREELR